LVKIPKTVNIVELPRREGGIGPPPARLTPAQARAWHDLVSVVDPGFLIRRDALWLELTAHVVAIARERPLEPEEVSNLCKMLKGLTLAPDSLEKLGLKYDWLEMPDDEEELEIPYDD
jgi:hypothetical protein